MSPVPIRRADVALIAAEAVARQRSDLEVAELQDAEADVVGALDLHDAAIAEARRRHEREAGDLIGLGALELGRDVDEAADLPAVAEQAERIGTGLGGCGKRGQGRQDGKGNGPQKRNATQRHRNGPPPAFQKAINVRDLALVGQGRVAGAVRSIHSVARRAQAWVSISVP